MIDVEYPSIEKYHHQYQPPLVFASLVEQAIREELNELLLTWLKAAKGEERRKYEPLETTANIVGWAIFGSALQWGQEEKTMSSEQMTERISQIIMEGVARLTPDALLEEEE